jgi:hypothetical protein
MPHYNILILFLSPLFPQLNVLKFEDKIVRFMKQGRERTLEFPPLSSYHRLIVYRIARRFGLQHQSLEPDSLVGGGGGGGGGAVYDNSHRPVILLKTAESATPGMLLIDVASPAQPPSLQNAGVSSQKCGIGGAVGPTAVPGKKIMLMKRDPKGSRASSSASAGTDKPKQLSVAEKEKAYAEAKARIFGTSSPSPGQSSSRSQSPSNQGTPESSPQVRHGRKQASGAYQQSAGPSSIKGFGRGRGKGSIDGRSSPEPPTPPRRPHSAGPGVDTDHSGAGYDATAAAAAQKAVVDAGEWLRDGRVKARGRAADEVDPDFQRNYAVYRPSFAPYREAGVPGVGIMPSQPGPQVRGMQPAGYAYPMADASMAHYRGVPAGYMPQPYPNLNYGPPPPHNYLVAQQQQQQQQLQLQQQQMAYHANMMTQQQQQMQQHHHMMRSSTPPPQESGPMIHDGRISATSTSGGMLQGNIRPPAPNASYENDFPALG